MKIKLLVLFIFFASDSLLISCGNKTPEAPKAPPPTAVNIYQVKKETAIYFDSYPATVAALNQVDLRAQVTGYITGIYFKDGEHVSKGQKLYDIDRQQYQANYDQAIANLNVARSALEKAQQDADRYNELLKQDAIAKQIVDHAATDLQSAKMQVAAAKANAARIESELKYSSIYAPFDGTIGISQMKMGALVTANQTLLNTVSSNDPMAVDIEVGQKEIPRFTQLFSHPAKETDSVFTLQLPDNSIYPNIGNISLIDRAIDPQTGTIKTRLIFSNKNNLLRSGLNCNVRVKNNNSENLFLLAPFKAVVEQMGEYFVFVVNDSSKVSQRKIQLGSKLNDKIIVKDGLNVGEKIVVDGVQKLRDGSTVLLASAKGK